MQCPEFLFLSQIKLDFSYQPPIELCFGKGLAGERRKELSCRNTSCPTQTSPNMMSTPVPATSLCLFGCGLSAVTFLLQPGTTRQLYAGPSTWAMLSWPSFAGRQQSSSGVVVEFIQQQDCFLTCKGWLPDEAIQTNTLSSKELVEYKHLHGIDLHLGR